MPRSKGADLAVEADYAVAHGELFAGSVDDAGGDVSTSKGADQAVEGDTATGAADYSPVR